MTGPDLEHLENLEEQLRSSFESQLPYQIARATMVKHLEFLPNHYFHVLHSNASICLLLGNTSVVSLCARPSRKPSQDLFAKSTMYLGVPCWIKRRS